jgi:hypothetical protein
MSWVAAAILGGSVISGAIGSHAASSAARTQANAANNATNTQLSMFNTLNDQQAPYRQAGQTSLDAIMRGFGLGDPNSPGGAGDGFFSHQFNAADLNANLAPNYAFMLDQGQRATTAQSNAMGGLGANSLADISRFTTGYAQNAYQQAYANYTANQTNIFNRLASIAGLGQTAGSNQTTGGSSFANGIAGTMVGAGNASAAGTVGSANAVSGAINNGVNGWLLSQFLRNGGLGAPAGGS